MGEYARGSHVGSRRLRLHISGQPWSKFCRNPGGGNRARLTGGRGNGVDSGSGGKRARILRFCNGDGRIPGGRRTLCGGCR